MPGDERKEEGAAEELAGGVVDADAVEGSSSSDEEESLQGEGSSGSEEGGP